VTDKEYREQKRRLKKLADRWLKPLGLLWWKVQIVYDCDGLQQPEDKSRSLIGVTTVDWHYLLATITFDMREIARQSDDDLEMQFVHECCHILINEMRMWAGEEMSRDKLEEVMKHEERTATMLAKAFIWTRQAGQGDE